ncbi:hypothetical protein A3762_14830 [Oleiphilus sp. HI0125]|uniref:hypothetical protein n=1 Tax=Oleiphilus sp. HI0125 TaxID=1822266 RepID=UPI0007C2FFAE|nr:hypothetical protein [Oleiphilus sp. HI0125]KZZ61055.1 hypothetical protein A3762_14830 [Oleiphilus sp. HI0125]
MSECEHPLNSFQNAVVSKTVKITCPSCNQSLYREHHLAGAFFGQILPIWLIALGCMLFISFAHFLAATIFVVTAVVGSYIWDTKRNSLKVYSAKQRAADKSKDKKTLLYICGFFAVSVVIYLTDK